MNKRLRRFGIFACFLLSLLGRPAWATIHYKVSLDHPESHKFSVRMQVPQVAPGTPIALPAWNALYQVRDFSYRLQELHIAAQSGSDHPAELIPVDKQTWTIGSRNNSSAASGSYEISYKI